MKILNKLKNIIATIGTDYFMKMSLLILFNTGGFIMSYLHKDYFFSGLFMLAVLMNITTLIISYFGNKINKPKELKIKYINKDITEIKQIDKGDWIDLRASKTIGIKQGEFALIPLGVAMQLPNGYEAHVVPRSSTFKTYGIIQTNSKGIIDESYCGDNDEWKMPVYATRNTVINFNERICQFRIVKKMPKLNIIKVDNLDNDDRGGFGSTGIK